MKTSEIEIVLQEIITCVERLDFTSLVPLIKKEIVKTNFPNKDTFLNFLKSLMDQAKKRAVGEIKCKIAFYDVHINKGFVSLNFYDQSHIHPVLRLEYKIKDKVLVLECPPF